MVQRQIFMLAKGIHCVVVDAAADAVAAVFDVVVTRRLQVSSLVRHQLVGLAQQKLAGSFDACALAGQDRAFDCIEALAYFGHPDTTHSM